LAVALAAQDTLGNFFGGVSIFLDGNYRIGDYIVLDSGERGEVVQIGLRSTTLTTRDDVQITVPNATMASSKIINQSAPARPFRVRLRIAVAYDTDVERMEALVLQAAEGHPDIMEEPFPRVRFRDFGDSALAFELLAWVAEPALQGIVRHEVGLAILDAFRSEDIAIPFPQMDVTVKSRPDIA
jgi:MscS family membrane protein